MRKFGNPVCKVCGQTWRLTDGPCHPQPHDSSPAAGSAPYGIIDPDYGRIYTIVRKLAWDEGYAIGLHGSFTRDLDLMAVPWAEKTSEAEHLVTRIVASNLKLRVVGGGPTAKPHGRRTWTLMLPEFGDPRFVDLSIFEHNTKDTPSEGLTSSDCSDNTQNTNQ